MMCLVPVSAAPPAWASWALWGAIKLEMPPGPLGLSHIHIDHYAEWPATWWPGTLPWVVWLLLHSVPGYICSVMHPAQEDVERLWPSAELLAGVSPFLKGNSEAEINDIRCFDEAINIVTQVQATLSHISWGFFPLELIWGVIKPGREHYCHCFKDCWITSKEVRPNHVAEKFLLQLMVARVQPVKPVNESDSLQLLNCPILFKHHS